MGVFSWFAPFRVRFFAPLKKGTLFALILERLLWHFQFHCLLLCLMILIPARLLFLSKVLHPCMVQILHCPTPSVAEAGRVREEPQGEVSRWCYGRACPGQQVLQLLEAKLRASACDLRGACGEPRGGNPGDACNNLVGKGTGESCCVKGCVCGSLKQSLSSDRQCYSAIVCHSISKSGLVRNTCDEPMSKSCHYQKVLNPFQ